MNYKEPVGGVIHDKPKRLLLEYVEGHDFVHVPAIPKSEARQFKHFLPGKVVTKKEDVTMKAAKNLARRLNSRINAMTTDSRSHADIVRSMARAAKIAPSTVRQILAGTIKVPPNNRIHGFERVLGISLSRYIKMANLDKLIDFADKIENEELQEQLLGLIGEIDEKTESEQSENQVTLTGLQDAVSKLQESVGTILEFQQKPEEPVEEPVEEPPAKIEDNEPVEKPIEESTGSLSDEDLIELGSNVEELSSLAESDSLDVEGLQLLNELNGILETELAELAAA